MADAYGFKTTRADITDSSAIGTELDREKPDVVINAAGKRGHATIDWCEDHKEETMQVNAVGAANLCIECAKRRIYFVHISTGCLYRYTGLVFNEDALPNFTQEQFYARTKFLAEEMIKNFPALIIRIRLPIDSMPHPANLIDKLKSYDKLINIKSSVTTIPNMLENLRYLINNGAKGIYHLVDSGLISPAEIMGLYKQIVNPDYKFSVISEAELAGMTKTPRAHCCLSNVKLFQAGGRLEPAFDAVVACLMKYKENL